MLHVSKAPTLRPVSDYPAWRWGVQFTKSCRPLLVGRPRISSIRSIPLTPSVFSGVAARLAGTYGYSAMLLVKNLPQPIRLIVSGKASARDGRLQIGTLRRMPRRGMTAIMSRWPEPVFQI